MVDTSAGECHDAYSLIFRYARRRALYRRLSRITREGLFLFVEEEVIKVAILIDGGCLRARSYQAKLRYEPNHIEAVALKCPRPEESLLRVLYYDCAPYARNVKLPVSGKPHAFPGSDAWLRELARKDLFAVRRGVLKFRGFVPKRTPIALTPLTDSDFKPSFEQKGVDMRIGLDIAQYANAKSVERIVLITEDTDCVPAMKHARKAGLQVVLMSLPNSHLAPELREHSDFLRSVAWP